MRTHVLAPFVVLGLAFGVGCVDAGPGEDEDLGPDAGPMTATEVAELTTPYTFA